MPRTPSPHRRSSGIRSSNQRTTELLDCREGHGAVVAVFVYRAHTDNEVVLRKEGERGARHVTDGDNVSPIRIVHFAPYHLIARKTRIRPLIPAQIRRVWGHIEYR